MTTIDRGKKITMTYRERGRTGRPTLIVAVSADSDILPHEHREDMREIAAQVMGVPLATLEGVEVEIKRTGGDHTHPGDHAHPHPHEHEHGQPVSLPAATDPAEPAKSRA